MHTQPIRLLSYAETIDRVGLSRTQISRLVAADQFPTPVEVAPRRVAFVEHEVETWIERRIANRDLPAARRARADRSEHFRNLVTKRWRDQAEG